MTTKSLKREQQKYLDQQALFESKKHQAEASLEKLKEAGNLKEAAVVFTHEGMNMFAQIFGNTMERIVNEAVENKFQSVMEGFFEGTMNQYLESIKPKLTLPVPAEQPQEGNESFTITDPIKWSDDFKKEVVKRHEEIDKGKELELIRNRNRYNNNNWTLEEDQFVFGEMQKSIQEGETVHFAAIKISKQMRTRTPNAVRSRYDTLKLLKNKDILEEIKKTKKTLGISDKPVRKGKMTRWTTQEDEELIEATITRKERKETLESIFEGFAEGHKRTKAAVAFRWTNVLKSKVKELENSKKIK